MNKSKVLCVAMLMLFAFSCAKIVSPEGGPKDTTAPQVIGGYPSSGETGVNGQEFSLEFDEYTTLTNPGGIIISPFVAEQPDIVMRGKKLQIKFKEPLPPGQTYSIAFGDNLKDLNEGNVMSNFTFVFSTGEKVDSSSISGNIVDYQTGKGAKDVWVGLYKDDTSFSKKTPFYIAKTNKEGSFKLNFIAAGKYELTALNDQNSNYYFDLPNEKISFSDTMLIVKENEQINYDLLLFEEDLRPQILNSKEEYGGKNIIDLTFPANNLVAEWIGAEELQDSILLDINENQQQIIFWQYYTDTTEQAILLKDDQEILDTLIVKPRKKALKEFEKEKINISRGRGGLGIAENEALNVAFNYPLDSIDINGLDLRLDKSQSIPKDSIDIQMNLNELEVKGNWEEGQKYELIILPNSIRDVYGRAFQDTVNVNMNISGASEKGDLILFLEERDSSMNYLYNLLGSKNQLVQKGTYGDVDSLIIKSLKAGKYSIKFIEDQNKNNRWDSGKYAEKRPAETILTAPKAIQIKNNWETEIKVNINDLK